MEIERGVQVVLAFRKLTLWIITVEKDARKSGRPSGSNKLGRERRRTQDVLVGRTSWEGWQAKSWTPFAINPERAPAEVRLLSWDPDMVTQRGRARGQCLEASYLPLATLPSLFNPLRRPSFRLPPIPGLVSPSSPMTLGLLYLA
jgi:hypothetical protein